MSESQFEKLLKTLSKTKEENDRLRELLKTSRKFLYHYCISDELIKRIDKEIGDESE